MCEKERKWEIANENGLSLERIKLIEKTRKMIKKKV